MHFHTNSSSTNNESNTPSFQSPEIKNIYIQNETLIYLGILTKLPLENPNRTRATHIMSHQNINIDPNIIPRAQLGLLRSSSHYLLGHGHRGLHLKKKSHKKQHIIINKDSKTTHKSKRVLKKQGNETDPVVEGWRCDCWGAATEQEILLEAGFCHRWEEEEAERPRSFWETKIK